MLCNQIHTSTGKSFIFRNAFTVSVQYRGGRLDCGVYLPVTHKHNHLLLLHDKKRREAHSLRTFSTCRENFQPLDQWMQDVSVMQLCSLWMPSVME